jgi:hypothetical protein
VRPHEDDACRHRVPGAPDEGIDDLLGLELGFPRGDEPEGLPRGVGQGVVERAFGYARREQDADDGHDERRSIADERDEGGFITRGDALGSFDHAGQPWTGVVSPSVDLFVTAGILARFDIPWGRRIGE